jgi:hypothetical protein
VIKKDSNFKRMPKAVNGCTPVTETTMEDANTSASLRENLLSVIVSRISNCYLTKRTARKSIHARRTQRVDVLTYVCRKVTTSYANVKINSGNSTKKIKRSANLFILATAKTPFRRQSRTVDVHKLARRRIPRGLSVGVRHPCTNWLQITRTATLCILVIGKMEKIVPQTVDVHTTARRITKWQSVRVDMDTDSTRTDTSAINCTLVRSITLDAVTLATGMATKLNVNVPQTGNWKKTPSLVKKCIRADEVNRRMEDVNRSVLRKVTTRCASVKHLHTFSTITKRTAMKCTNVIARTSKCVPRCATGRMVNTTVRVMKDLNCWLTTSPV